jgi:Spy/CpxP family protein refolding chaperone
MQALMMAAAPGITAGPLGRLGLGPQQTGWIHYLVVGGVSFIAAYLAVGAWLDRGAPGGSGGKRRRSGRPADDRGGSPEGLRATQPLAVAAVALPLAGTCAVAAEPAAHAHPTGNPDAVLYHANPLPNFMRLIAMHGDTLALTQAQQGALAAWREQNHARVQDLLRAVGQAEAELRDLALGQADTGALKAQYTEIEQLRRQIAETKIACRANLQRILSPEQFARVTALYGEHLLAQHVP